MRWSWRLGKIAGINVYLHWTFLLLIGWLTATLIQDQKQWLTIVRTIGFVLAVFACVVLHELGHALAARQFGIATRDITLLVIGGVARLERMPQKPRQELSVAAAGPLVNVMIAIVLLIVIESLFFIHQANVVGTFFLAQLMWINVILVIFNLIPAFPMDGGRILRALLAIRVEYLLATKIAATIGQMVAITFGIVGVLKNWWLLLIIAIFVYLGAKEEIQIVNFRALLRGVAVRDVMTTRFYTFNNNDSLTTAMQKLSFSSQQVFPVIDGNHFVGMVTRNDLLASFSKQEADMRVAEVVRHNCLPVDERKMLGDTFEYMRASNSPTLPVVSEGRLVGLVTLENIGEWILNCQRKT